MNMESGMSGDLLSFQTEGGLEALAAFAENPEEAVFMSDWDGCLGEIVEFPTMPYAHRQYYGQFEHLVGKLGAAGLVTGRSVGQVAQFGKKDHGWESGLLVPGIHVFGQFGIEWWHDNRLTQLTRRPDTIDMVDDELPGVLAKIGLAHAKVEDVKSCMRAVHIPLGTPKGKVIEANAGLTELAHKAKLVAHPGNGVIEIGPPEIDKGKTFAFFLASLRYLPSAIIYPGDGAQDLLVYAILDWYHEEYGVPICKVGVSDNNGDFANEEVKRQSDLHVRGPQAGPVLLDRLCQLTA